ncbi:MAG TPA: CoA transferase [Myxococcales bacterium]|nr:CoA transferase [Myxococcales bacterium]
MPMALDDLLVLDLSHALAGPFASTWLADNGANVLKIEPPTGDISRAWGPPFRGKDSAYFVSLNRNKRSVVVDLKHPDGKEIFFRLAERADVLIENFRVGTVAKLGIDYLEVKARNPRIVYCSISGFGQTGPYRDRAAMDLIVQAESGMISLTGEPGSRGVRCGISIADLTAGMNAAFAILAALHARGRTGRGQFLDVSMLEGQLGLLDTVIGGYLADGIVPGPMGTAYKALLPYQTFRTRTRDIAIAVGSDSLWRIFCPLLGLEDMRDDPRYATNAARSANRESLIERLQAAFLLRSYEEWEAILLPAGIPMGAINTIDRAVDHPQVAARKSFATCNHPVAGEVKVVALNCRMSETPGGLRSPAPLLGQHTSEVLREILGLPEAEIDRLGKAGAVGIRAF